MEARELDSGPDQNQTFGSAGFDHFPRVLVLNASYEPLRIISWQRAVILLLGRKIDVLDSYEILIHSPSVAIYLPSVVRMKKYITPKKARQVPRFSRYHVFLRDSFKCQYCFRPFPSKELTLDHVLPVARGGKKTWSNIVTCCKVCNQQKGAKTPHEAGYSKFQHPREPSPNFLPDILYYKEKMPSTWLPYLEWLRG